MKKGIAVLVAVGVFSFGFFAILNKAEAAKKLSTGGNYSVFCLDYGLEMRDGSRVKSCLLAQAGEFEAIGGQQISCLDKYAIAFTPQGKVEYCTLSRDVKLHRTATEQVTAMAMGRAAFYPSGMLEIARLKDTTQLPFASKSTVVCRGASPVSFRADGYVATCILDQEGLFVSDAKKKTASSCQAGGLIAFDNDGKFSGCYPPPMKQIPDAKALENNSSQQGGKTL